MGLIGHNGAGKSTLVKILAGVFQYDDPNLLDHKSGMYLLGRKVIFKNPSDAIKQRIMMIHQELNVIPDLSVYENIFLNNEISRFGFIDRVGMISETQKMIDAFDAEMKPSDIVKNLSVDKQKLVEVLKAISQDAKVLIMDEPTSVLLDAEVEYVFKVMKNIVEKGIGIVFISHNLGEIVSICDRVTVLRDGKLVAGMDKGSFDTDKLVSVMVGKRLADLSEFGAVRSKSDEMMLEIHGLRYKNLVRDVSFAVKKGEIVGITGLVGSGGTELAKTILPNVSGSSTIGANTSSVYIPHMSSVSLKMAASDFERSPVSRRSSVIFGKFDKSSARSPGPHLLAQPAHPAHFVSLKTSSLSIINPQGRITQELPSLKLIFKLFPAKATLHEP
ncbi:MAG: ATP-binding cassette domain-containing protein [Caldiserica bacterium]|nr:ATP-binding cassette domain-containing protein [Caldisericota bacterium]